MFMLLLNYSNNQIQTDNMIEILYSLAGSVALVASGSQVHQLIRSGRSDELSISTWALWCGAQTIAFIYMISIHQPLLIVFNGLWAALYALMAGLILYYRRYPRQVIDLDSVRLPEEAS